MRLLCLIFLMFLINGLNGQIITIRDSLLKSPIENANLIFEKIGASSNVKGEANITVFKKNNVIQITHLNYKTKKIAKKNIRQTVYLSQKLNILPTIILNDVTKIPLPKSNAIFTIRPSGVKLLESSVAGLLASASQVTVQESQAGGGSPNYRGMEANRLLLVVDEIPINNAIYRSGHLQSSATINPFFIESVSLISGPASVAYGNGSMGGALVFYTKKPSNINKLFLHQQFESNSNTVITNMQAFYHKKKLSHISGFSLKSAGNLSMGRNRMHGYNEWGKELSKNNEQPYTNYEQADFIHKSNYKINTFNSIAVNTQYSISSNIYRFDKMNDIKNGAQKYNQWYYGPQIRFLQSINYVSKNKTIAFDNIKFLLAFQNIKESRHVQTIDSELLNNRKEHVNLYDANIDLNKKIKKTKIIYGVGARHQNVNSSAYLSDGQSTFYNPTRYPEKGSAVQDVFAYGQVAFNIYKDVNLLIGARLNKERLIAKFNNPFLDFDTIKNNNVSFVKSILLSYKIKASTLSLSYYDGFRNPNIDDIGKIFSKDGENVLVPNATLEPEYSNNLEASLNISSKFVKIKIALFKNNIYNAISREYAVLNGADSMIYDGEMMRIQMNKNISAANIRGVSFSGTIGVNSRFLIKANCNYLKGITNENKPLARIPPFNSKLGINYKLNDHLFDFYTDYNAWKRADEYDDAGIDNFSEATQDGNPCWYTLNLIYSNKIDNSLTLMLGIKNMLDVHYKVFSSSLSAGGRNFILSLRASF
ncbi:MAG: hypothetical protein CMD08_01035 [Flavobacteriales bacterium]|nr:hypothetical protein [Flavobacteriales bacterium]